MVILLTIATIQVPGKTLPRSLKMFSVYYIYIYTTLPVITFASVARLAFSAVNISSTNIKWAGSMEMSFPHFFFRRVSYLIDVGGSSTLACFFTWRGDYKGRYSALCAYLHAFFTPAFSPPSPPPHPHNPYSPILSK